MTVKKEIRQKDDPILRKVIPMVEVFDDELTGFCQELEENRKASELAGLAASQVGVTIRAFTALNPNQGDGEPDHYIFINPDILETSSATEIFWEGCGSVDAAQSFGQVERYKWIRVKAKDIEGREFNLKAKGYLARIIQHETDHLNGILYIDKLVPGTNLISKQEYIALRQMEKEQKNQA
jgi:peptide deformylase